jgi:NADH-quinone oxidoreductase subunit C/D
MTVSERDVVTANPLARFLPGSEDLDVVTAADGFTEITTDRSRLIEVLRALRDRPELDCNLLLDVCAVDYLKRPMRFDVVYHLTSLEKGHRVRVRVPVDEDDPRVPTAYGLWKAADWFEREAWDMMGVRFDGHPNLRRILTHEAFQGHPLRKDYDAEKRWLLTEAETFVPDWVNSADDQEDQFETQVINIGPSHPATHGTLRIVARLDGEIITRAECEIGYLHRCFEKMSETHGWNEVIPFTDRLNYCSSMINGVGYALGVEQMLGIEAPPRAQVVRLILSEFSRLMDHAVCLGATLVDVGALTNFWYLSDGFVCTDRRPRPRGPG